METSAFMDVNRQPNEEDIKRALEHMYHPWCTVRDFALHTFPGSSEEWKFSKAGWNGRIRNKKGNMLYFMPCIGSFRVSFVFGKKAAEQAQQEHISDHIKKMIGEAPVYAEGRGFRVEVTDKLVVGDIEKLILIKAAQ